MSVHTYGNQQPINRNAKGLEESYAPGKRFNDHRRVNLISSSVSVQACTKCSVDGNVHDEMTRAVSKDTGSPGLTIQISRTGVAILFEQEPRGQLIRRKFLKISSRG